MKFAKLCNQCKGCDGRIRTKTSKFGLLHTCTGCKALQSFAKLIFATYLHEPKFMQIRFPEWNTHK